jgi:hypothetical protein
MRVAVLTPWTGEQLNVVIANFLGWSRRGADLILTVRCAVYNGKLGSAFGHRIEAFANPKPILVPHFPDSPPPRAAVLAETKTRKSNRWTESTL